MRTYFTILVGTSWVTAVASSGFGAVDHHEFVWLMVAFSGVSALLAIAWKPDPPAQNPQGTEGGEK